MMQKQGGKQMNGKRISAAGLALAMTASLVPTALAAEEVTALSPAGYQTQLYLNGAQLDTAAIPAASQGLIPMRLLTEADDGYASWFEEENQGFFALDGASIIVNFSDLSVLVEGEELEGVTATLTDGVTFLPASVLDGLEGYSVDLEPDGDRVDVTTPNGQPLTLLAKEIRDAIPMACSQKNSAQEMTDFLGVDAANFDEVVCFSSMMVRSDALIIGKLAEGADRDAVLEQLESRRAAIEESFYQYLPDPYEMAQNGQIVEEGDYVMLVISEDNDRAISLFRAAVAQD
jgi:hypothetical protein